MDRVSFVFQVKIQWYRERLYSEIQPSDMHIYSLVTGSVLSCAISTPLGAYNSATISVLGARGSHCHPCTHLHLSEVKQVMVKYLAQGYTNRTKINIRVSCFMGKARILVQVTIYCRLLIGRDGHLNQSEAYLNCPKIRALANSACVSHGVFRKHVILKE